MKVPSPTQGRVRPVLGQSAYTQGSSSVGVGAAALAKGLGAFGAQLQQRNDQTNRFNTLRGFSQFETDVAAKLTELKRNFSPDGKGFAEAANALYTEAENEWLPGVPQDLQDEFRYRTQQRRQGIMGDALEFQYKAGDAWFRQGIADELSKSNITIDQNPGALAAEQKRIFDIINASDLSAAEKVELQRQATIGLASTTYKAEVRDYAGSRGALGVGDPTSVVDRIVGIESGGNPNAKNPNSSAEGAGQFIDSTWLDMLGRYRPDITGSREQLLALKRDPALSREMVQRYAEENSEKLSRAGVTPNNGNVYLGHFLGPAGAIAVGRAAPDTPVSQILGADQIAANSSILAGKTAGEVRAWAARKMGNATLETDPRFAAIPFEDRVALRADADRDATAADLARAKAAKEQQQAARDDLYLGLLDGKRGQMDIDNARAQGVLDDYESVNKAMEILKKRDGDQMLAMNGYTKLANNGVFDPTEKDDKDMLNAMTKAENGLERISNGDKEYFSRTFAPRVVQTGDIPTEAAGTLMGMVRGANNPAMLYALDALSQLRDQAPIAFNQRITGDVAKRVDLWDALKGQGTDQAELLNRIRGGNTQAERQQQVMLREEAEKVLTKPESQALLSQAIDSFDQSYWSDPSINVPAARQAFAREFNTFFTEAYSKTGDAEQATELATKELQRQWGVSAVGAGNSLMKYPPEKVGYRAVNGSFDWINQAVRDEMQLGEDESFELFSDEQTRQEFQRFQRDPQANPPSYRVFVKDATGVPRERLDERGRPERRYFKPTEAALRDEAAAFDRKEREFEVNEILLNYARMKQEAMIDPLNPREIPQEETDLYNEALREAEELKSTDPAIEQMRQRYQGGSVSGILGGN